MPGDDVTGPAASKSQTEPSTLAGQPKEDSPKPKNPNGLDELKNKWAVRQSRAIVFAGGVAFITFAFQFCQYIFQYIVKPEQAIELSIEPKQLEGLKLTGDDQRFYLDVTVKAKNVGTRDYTMCFEDPIDGFESNCDPEALSSKQSSEFTQDEVQILQIHKQEILVDNDQVEFEKLRTGATHVDKKREAEFDQIITKLQSEKSAEQAPQRKRFKMPRIPPLNVARVMASASLSKKGRRSLSVSDIASLSEFKLGESIPADLWKEDKGRQPLKGLDIRAGETETVRALVSVPCPGLYRVAFAVRYPKDEAKRANLAAAQEPIWSTSEFFVVRGPQSRASECTAKDDGNKDTSQKSARGTPQSSRRP